jgi:hypothetical protein
MSNDILDLPAASLPVFDNKAGGLHTTPFFYTAIAVMGLGTILIPVPLAGVFLSIPFFFSSSWVKVDVNTRMICRYWKVAGFKVRANNWEPLPAINAVTVIRVKETQTLASRGSQTTMSDLEYKVRIAGEGRNVWDLLTAETREEALLKAGKAAFALNVKLVDYTDSNRKPTHRRR